MALTFATKTPINKIRNRGLVLKALVPKMFGILYQKSKKIGDQPFTIYSVRFDENREVMGTLCSPHFILIDIYWPVNSVPKKVFSARVTDLPDADEPVCTRNWTYRIGNVSWRRGEWEEAIGADGTPARSLSELYLRHQLPV
jgi:hypothetical protein